MKKALLASGLVALLLMGGWWVMNAGWQPTEAQPGSCTPVITGNAAALVASTAAAPMQAPFKKTPPAEIQADPLAAAKASAAARQILNQVTSRPQTPGAPALQGLARGYGHRVADPRQQAAIDELLSQLGPGAILHMDATAATIRHLEGDLSKVVAGHAAFENARAAGNYPLMAKETLNALAAVMGQPTPGDHFVEKSVEHDQLGMTHVKLQQEERGLPVYGSELIVHFTAAAAPCMINGVQAPNLIPPAPPVEIPPTEAIAKAQAAMGQAGGVYRAPQTTRLIYWSPQSFPIDAYLVEVFPAATEYWRVFVNAADGSVLHVGQGIQTEAAVGSGTDLWGRNTNFFCWNVGGGTYFALDSTLPIYDPASTPPDVSKTKGAVGILDCQNYYLNDAVNQNKIIWVNSTSLNSWPAAAVTLQDNVRRVLTYYRTKHGRNSIDDANMNVLANIRVAFSADGNQDNACWHPGVKMLFFGGGTTVFNEKLPTLDITGHELTHGVVSHTADLIYENQSGALNEHLADFFGCMVDPSNWLIWDGAMRSASLDACRDLSNPKNPRVQDSYQPMKMSQFYNLPNTPEKDNGGVHVNCGIPNYASYLYTDPASSVGGMGRATAEQVAYRALTKYLTKYSQFIDFRRAMIRAATDLHGEGNETAALRAAFDAVELTDASGEVTPTNTPGPIVSGDEYALFLGPYSGGGGYVMNQLRPDGLPEQISWRYVANTRPAVSGGGNYALYVGSDNNVYWTTGITGEEQWTDTANIRTVAMSKDARYITFTTTAYDNQIYVIDTVASNTLVATLAVPDSQSILRPLEYADVMSFTYNGDTLVYDALSKTIINNSTSLTWNVYALRMKDLVSRLAMADVQGLQVANPSCAHSVPLRFVCDYLFTDVAGAQTIGALVVDLNQGQYNVLGNGLPIYAQPSYRGGDTSIVYMAYSAFTYYIYQGTLISNGMAFGTATPLYWSASPLYYPVGFRSGTYTAPIGSLGLSPSDLNYGTIYMDQPATGAVRLANSGNGDLELIALTIEGSASNSFRQATPAKPLMPPGYTQNVGFVFSPREPGIMNVSLRGRSSVPGQADQVITLRGTALPPASWITQYWASAGAYTGNDADDDGDGESNSREFIAGTMPRGTGANLSYFRAQGAAPQANGPGVWINPALSGRWYHVLYKADMLSSTWLPLRSNITGAGSAQWVTDTNPPSTLRSYRVGVQMQP